MLAYQDPGIRYARAGRYGDEKDAPSRFVDFQHTGRGTQACDWRTYVEAFPNPVIMQCILHMQTWDNTLSHSDKPHSEHVSCVRSGRASMDHGRNVGQDHHARAPTSSSEDSAGSSDLACFGLMRIESSEPLAFVQQAVLHSHFHFRT